MRQLSRETGVVPTEASAHAPAPRARAQLLALWARPGPRVLALRASAMPASRDAPVRPRRAGRSSVVLPASWGSETRRTVAVLPFKNLAGDPEASFYEFSLADGVITELAQVRSLVVRPSTYIAPYVGPERGPAAGGRGAGRLRPCWSAASSRRADRLRVTAQLISTATGRDPVEREDRHPDAPTSSPAGRDRRAGRRGPQAAAHRGGAAKIEQPAHAQRRGLRVLPARPRPAVPLHAADLDESDLEEAIKMFNEAIGMDPEFARAHTALGRCYVQHARGYGGPEYYVLAERALRRALELDPTLVDARLQMVYVDLHHGDKERRARAIEELRREAPDDPVGALRGGDALPAGRPLREGARDLRPAARAEPAGHRARGLQPRRASTRTSAATTEAVAELERARAVEPEHPLIKTFLAVALFNQGRGGRGPGPDRGDPEPEPALRRRAAAPGLVPLRARRAREGPRPHHRPRASEIAAADHDIAFWLASFYGMEGHGRRGASNGCSGPSGSATRTTPSSPTAASSTTCAADPRFAALMRTCGSMGVPQGVASRHKH